MKTTLLTTTILLSTVSMAAAETIVTALSVQLRPGQPAVQTYRVPNLALPVMTASVMPAAAAPATTTARTTKTTCITVKSDINWVTRCRTLPIN